MENNDRTTPPPPHPRFAHRPLANDRRLDGADLLPLIAAPAAIAARPAGRSDLQEGRALHGLCSAGGAVPSRAAAEPLDLGAILAVHSAICRQRRMAPIVRAWPPPAADRCA